LSTSHGTRNGFEVPDLARKHRPDLILMDIQLPEVSGLEVTKWLKEDPELKSIPVVAVTAFAMKGDEERIRENRSHHFRRTAGRPFRGRSGTDRPQEHGSEQSAIRCPRYGGSGRSPHHEQPPFGLRLYSFATIGITPTV
jgi:CheY-like chemotaxis protein